MRTFVSLLVGLGISFALGAVDLGWLHGEHLAILSRPIALVLAALTGIRFEQELALVLLLAAMPITLVVIGIGIGMALDAALPGGAFRPSDRPLRTR